MAICLLIASGTASSCRRREGVALPSTTLPCTTSRCSTTHSCLIRSYNLGGIVLGGDHKARQHTTGFTTGGEHLWAQATNCVNNSEFRVHITYLVSTACTLSFRAEYIKQDSSTGSVTLFSGAVGTGPGSIDWSVINSYNSGATVKI